MSSGGRNERMIGVRPSRVAVVLSGRARSGHWLACGDLGLRRAGTDECRGGCGGGRPCNGEIGNQGEAADEPDQQIWQRIGHRTEVDRDEPARRAAHADDGPAGKIARRSSPKKDQARPREYREDPESGGWKAELGGATERHVVNRDVDVRDRVAMRLSNPVFADELESYPANTVQRMSLEYAQRGRVGVL